MNFQPLNSMQSTNATFLVDHLLEDHAKSLLLPDGRTDSFFDLTESQCSDKLGEPFMDWMEEKGHGKEWYYTAPSGRLVGIAFRWGNPRLRGNALTTVEDVVQFIDFLEQAVKNCPSK